MEVVPGALSLLAWSVSLSLKTSSVQLMANVSGTVAVGGSNWLVLNASGWLDTSSEAVGVEVLHGGGWSPLDGPLASSFVTPRFDGTLLYSSGQASLAALVEYERPISLLHGLLNISSAIIGTGGPSLSVRVAGSDDWGAQMSAMVQVGGFRNRPPSISAFGSIRSHAHTEGTLTLATSSEWRPLPRRLAALVVPRLDG